jgi:hypothetical protein
MRKSRHPERLKDTANSKDASNDLLNEHGTAGGRGSEREAMTYEEWLAMSRTEYPGGDAQNPAFLFATTDSELLRRIVSGEINVLEDVFDLARHELRSRGE